MNDLEQLLAIQQEYEYFTKRSKELKTKEDYELLKKDPVFQSSYLQNVFAICDKRLSLQRVTKRTSVK